MSFLSNASRSRIILLGILAFTLGSTSLALGLVVNGVITGCYNNTSGVLRVETTSVPCFPIGETRVSWNQPGPQGPSGAAGSTGSTGAPGATGPTGPAGIAGYEVVASAPVHIENENSFVEAFCPPGKEVIGGGFRYAGTVDITLNRPVRLIGPKWFWVVQGENGLTEAGDFTAYAVCATVP